MFSYHYAMAWGISLLLASAAIRYKIGKRRFNRRSLAGLERFSSYRRAVLTRLVECLFSFLAKLMLVAGLLLLLIASL
jgi:hypothetical protein